MPSHLHACACDMDDGRLVPRFRREVANCDPLSRRAASTAFPIFVNPPWRTLYAQPGMKSHFFVTHFTGSRRVTRLRALPLNVPDARDARSTVPDVALRPQVVTLKGQRWPQRVRN
jgi:hypothetical protein